MDIIYKRALIRDIPEARRKWRSGARDESACQRAGATTLEASNRCATTYSGTPSPTRETGKAR
jgi:hypothetical protein